MKLVGNISIIAEEENINLQAIITENNGLYDIELYQLFDDGNRGKNMLPGQWASTVGSAKRQINQDRGFKNKDWDWQKI